MRIRPRPFLPRIGPAGNGLTGAAWPPHGTGRTMSGRRRGFARKEARMDLGLGGKAALVTASSTGLGRAVAVALGREGARVMLCARSAEKLGEAVREVERAGGEAHAFCCDLTDSTSIDAALAEAAKRFGGVDVLVTNSGGPPPGMLGDIAEEAWRTAADSLLFSVIRLARGVLPHMKE
ncbi:MAG: SDR family NAD(P)-dependent oxidoreductase, partial [Candidatus Latescibacterota bacterium]